MHRLYHGLRHFRGRRPSAHIRRSNLALGEHAVDGTVDEARIVELAEMLEEERGAADGRERVGNVLAVDVGCAAVDLTTSVRVIERVVS